MIKEQPLNEATKTAVYTMDDLRSLEPGIFLHGQRTRLDVKTDHTTLPFLVVSQAGAGQLTVLNNGAVDQEKALGRPIFQRSSWCQEINRHQVYFCDPGTVGDDRLSLAWGQLNEEHWVIYDAVRAIKQIARLLRVSSAEDRCYFGSSAGGFMALSMAANDAGSSALVNNSQFDWTRWMATGLNPLRELRFNNALPVDLRKKHPIRTNVLKLLAKRNRAVRIRYYVNLASKHDRDIDLPMFKAFVNNNPTLAKNIQTTEYWDENAGHNPLPRGETIRLLNAKW